MSSNEKIGAKKKIYKENQLENSKEEMNSSDIVQSLLDNQEPDIKIANLR